MDHVNSVFFYKGQENAIPNIENREKSNTPSSLDRIRDSFSKVLDGKNLSFLLGSGCSSYFSIFEDAKNTKSTEVGIPTMAPLASEFYTTILKEDYRNWLKEKLNIDVTHEQFAKNLESFLGTLHSFYFYLEKSGQSNEEIAKQTSDLIMQARNFLLRKCLNEDNKILGYDVELIELYKKFYRKLLYRNSNLPKPNIFTTNYDLYSELALDSLGIHYVNGFSGGIKKYFNPTIFNYALAEKMDLSQSKWSVIDNFVYLYKLHGSVNWIQDSEDTKLFKVREIQEATFTNLEKKEVIMIHPTPLKYNASMGSPYSDLFREFQKKLMQNNNVLITIGYSFSDEHINNLIYQAFTIPSFRLIIIADPKYCVEIEKLQNLDDPRIWIIGGDLPDKSKLHYFKGFVEQILPELTNEQVDEKIENAIRKLIQS